MTKVPRIVGMAVGMLLGAMTVGHGQEASARVVQSSLVVALRVTGGPPTGPETVSDFREDVLRIAKGEAQEHYHPAAGESAESIQIHTDVVEARKKARRDAERRGGAPDGGTAPAQAAGAVDEAAPTLPAPPGSLDHLAPESFLP